MQIKPIFSQQRFGTASFEHESSENMEMTY